MAGDDMHLGINQKRHVKAKCLYTSGDLLHLLFGMPPWVFRVRFETACCPVLDS